MSDDAKCIFYIPACDVSRCVDEKRPEPRARLSGRRPWLKPKRFQKLTAPRGLPRRPATLALTGPCAVQLRRSEDIRRGVAVGEGRGRSGTRSRCIHFRSPPPIRPAAQTRAHTHTRAHAGRATAAGPPRKGPGGGRAAPQQRRTHTWRMPRLARNCNPFSTLQGRYPGPCEKGARWREVHFLRLQRATFRAASTKRRPSRGRN